MFQYSTYPNSRILERNNQSKYTLLAYLLAGIVILFIGLRPLSYVFIDMVNYNEYYVHLIYNETHFEFDPDALNLIYDNFFSYLAINGYDISVFFFLMAALNFGCLFFALKKFYPNDILYAFIIYLGAFSTFPYATNGLKAGVAASIFLLALAFYKKPVYAILFCFLALGFHHSMKIPIVAFLMAYYIKNPKFFFYFWGVCFLFSLFHLTGPVEFLAQFGDEGKVGEYLSAIDQAWEGKSGFRLDFILYGFPPIAIGYWLIFKKRIYDRLFLILLGTYMISNSVWLLLMYVPFNNRFAYLSWLLLPVVCVYPFFKLKLPVPQYKYLNYVVGLYLAFFIFAYFYF